MSLKIHWPIIFSIRVCSLILIILLDWKMYKLQIIYYFILQDLILIQKWKHPKCQWKNHSNIKITIFQPFSVKRNLEGLNLLMGITSLYTSITVSTAKLPTSVQPISIKGQKIGETPPKSWLLASLQFPKAAPSLHN